MKTYIHLSPATNKEEVRGATRKVRCTYVTHFYLGALTAVQHLIFSYINIMQLLLIASIINYVNCALIVVLMCILFVLKVDVIKQQNVDLQLHTGIKIY